MPNPYRVVANRFQKALTREEDRRVEIQVTIPKNNKSISFERRSRIWFTGLIKIGRNERLRTIRFLFVLLWLCFTSCSTIYRFLLILSFHIILQTMWLKIGLFTPCFVLHRYLRLSDVKWKATAWTPRWLLSPPDLIKWFDTLSRHQRHEFLNLYALILLSILFHLVSSIPSPFNRRSNCPACLSSHRLYSNYRLLPMQLQAFKEKYAQVKGIKNRQSQLS